MKTLLATALSTGILLAPTMALAGTQTYKTTGGDQVTVGTTVPADGRVIQGGMQKGTSVTTMADGTKVNEKWTCISTTQPPHAKIFDIHSLCDVSSARGNYSIAFGCTIMSKEGALGCVGGLYGKTGEYEGKGGGTTWMGINGNGTGTAQWTD